MQWNWMMEFPTEKWPTEAEQEKDNWVSIYQEMGGNVLAWKSSKQRLFFSSPSQYCSYGVKSYLTPVLRGMALLRGSARHQDKSLSLLN